MKKFFIAGLLFLLLKPTAAYSAGDFDVSFKSIYTVSDAAATSVTHKIDLTNNQPNLFASEYSLNLAAGSIKDIAAFDSSGSLPVAIDRGENSTSIKVNLESRPVVGPGKTKTFSIKYQNNDLASHVGKILEVNTPRVINANEFDKFEVVLDVPAEFGAHSVAIPKPQSESYNAGRHVLTFTDGHTSGISAVFGTSQLFNFQIDYYLENANNAKEVQEITLIPDTPYQQVSYQKIEPLPNDYMVDNDGNWLAKYVLDGKQKITIRIEGTVETFMNPRSGTYAIDPSTNLSSAKYWQSDDKEIVELSQQLKTPKAIYDYVVGKLSYDYSKVENNGPRLGAKQVLQAPDQAICTEFTDLFIALARAAGIPARELNGFAFTQNPKLRPLSLSKDILHAWPEYWDNSLSQWIPVDPTWGDTTNGVDYFSKLDFNHVVFSIHGKSPTSPLPAGFFKTDSFQGKTVNISPTSDKIKINGGLKINFDLPSTLPSYRNYNSTLTITNQTGIAIYDLPLSIEPTQFIVNSTPPKIKYLLPFQTVEIPVILKPNSLFDATTSSLTVKIGDINQSYELSFSPPLTQNQAVFVAIGLGAVVSAVIAFLARRIYFSRPKA